MATVPDSSLPLPIVDLEKAKDPSQRLTVAQKLVEALETVGFLFIDNVEGFDAGKLLAHTQWFFNLSEQEKHRLARKLWNPESQNHYRGLNALHFKLLFSLSRVCVCVCVCICGCMYNMYLYM